MTSVPLEILLEDIARAADGESPLPAPPEQVQDEEASGEEVPVTGYEISDDDWEGLRAIAAGDAAQVPEEIVSWLAKAELVQGSPPVPTQFALEWMRGQ